MRKLRYLSPILMLSTSLAAAEMPKVGGLFRGELNMDNNKTMENTNTKSGSLATTGQMAFFDLTANGSLSENVKFESQIEFVNGTFGALPRFCAGSPVKRANASWWVGSMFSATIGCSKDRVGGWDFANYDEASTIHPLLPIVFAQTSNGYYGPNYSMYNPAIDLSLHMFGDLTLRIQNDVSNQVKGAPAPVGPASWNKRTQQTWGLEWKGDIAGIKPILQYYSFDDGHSWTSDIGLNVMAGGLGVTADWMALAWSNKTTVGTSYKAKVDNSNRFSLEVTYAVANIVTPYIYWSNYKNKKDVNDPGANSAPGVWDHEGNVISVGAWGTGLSSNYSPYIAFDFPGGRFLQSNGNKSTKTDFVARLGAVAHF